MIPRGLSAARCPLPAARCPLPAARCPLPTEATKSVLTPFPPPLRTQSLEPGARRPGALFRITRDECDRTLGGERAAEEIHACEAVHVAAHRQAQVVEDRRGNVDDRSAFVASRIDLVSVGDQE